MFTPARLAETGQPTELTGRPVFFFAGTSTTSALNHCWASSTYTTVEIANNARDHDDQQLAPPQDVPELADAQLLPLRFIGGHEEDHAVVAQRPGDVDGTGGILVHVSSRKRFGTRTPGSARPTCTSRPRRRTRHAQGHADRHDVDTEGEIEGTSVDRQGDDEHQHHENGSGLSRAADFFEQPLYHAELQAKQDAPHHRAREAKIEPHLTEQPGRKIRLLGRIRVWRC